MPSVPVSAAAARRLLLDAQGMLDDPRRPCTPASLQELIERLGFVQIDSINVVDRAHHLTLASRMDRYNRSVLATLLERDRTLFEHWTHDASAIPSAWFGHWKHRFERFQQRMARNKGWFTRLGPRPQKVLDHVRDRISAEGPLQSRDFEHIRNGSAGWWDWKPQKLALEYLWRTGELAVAARVNFQKVYDLTPRVLSDVHHLPESQPHEYVDWACRAAMQRLGVATPKELSEYWHGFLAADAAAWCRAAVASGEIEPVTVESLDGSPPRKAFAIVDWKQRLEQSAAAPRRIRLLSPFDPVLRDRQRALRLFNFDYRFEAFVPAAKRVFGYYAMPLLEGERLIGRVDPKFHRDRGELRINAIWLQPGVQMTPARRTRLEAATARLARQIGAEHWTLPTRTRTTRAGF